MDERFLECSIIAGEARRLLSPLAEGEDPTFNGGRILPTPTVPRACACAGVVNVEFGAVFAADGGLEYMGFNGKLASPTPPILLLLLLPPP